MDDRQCSNITKLKKHTLPPTRQQVSSHLKTSVLCISVCLTCHNQMLAMNGQFQKRNTHLYGHFSFQSVHLTLFQKNLRWRPVGYLALYHSTKCKNKNGVLVFTACKGRGCEHYWNWAHLSSTSHGPLFQ